MSKKHLSMISELLEKCDCLTRELVEWKADQSYSIACQTIRTLKAELAEAKARAVIPDGWVAVPIGVIELCAEIEVEDVHDDNGPGHIVCTACKGSARMKWGRGGRLDSHSEIGHAADCPAVFARNLLSARQESPPNGLPSKESGHE